ncbi:MAG: hypothetical protein AAF841_12940 [Pseudomonadota bacterium]
MRGTIWILAAGALGIALLATKPSQADVVDLVRDEIRGALLAMSPEEFDDPTAEAIAAACTVFSGPCASLISLAFPITYEDRYVFAEVTLAEGTSDEVSCWAALNQIFCQGL